MSKRYKEISDQKAMESILHVQRVNHQRELTYYAACLLSGEAAALDRNVLELAKRLHKESSDVRRDMELIAAHQRRKAGGVEIEKVAASTHADRELMEAVDIVERRKELNPLKGAS